jgi:hypothetical protein
VQRAAHRAGQHCQPDSTADTADTLADPAAAAAAAAAALTVPSAATMTVQSGKAVDLTKIASEAKGKCCWKANEVSRSYTAAYHPWWPCKVVSLSAVVQSW